MRGRNAIIRLCKKEFSTPLVGFGDERADGDTTVPHTRWICRTNSNAPYSVASHYNGTCTDKMSIHGMMGFGGRSIGKQKRFSADKTRKLSEDYANMQTSLIPGLRCGDNKRTLCRKSGLRSGRVVSMTRSTRAAEHRQRWRKAFEHQQTELDLDASRDRQPI